MSDEEDVGKMKTVSRVSLKHPPSCLSTQLIAIEAIVLYIYQLESALPSKSMNHFLGPMGANRTLTEKDRARP